MLGVVSQGINALQLAMEEIGLSDKVTTFTASDFARTLTSNGFGVDRSNLVALFPNLDRFYNLNSSRRTVEFMKS